MKAAVVDGDLDEGYWSARAFEAAFWRILSRPKPHVSPRLRDERSPDTIPPGLDARRAAAGGSHIRSHIGPWPNELHRMNPVQFPPVWCTGLFCGVFVRRGRRCRFPRARRVFPTSRRRVSTMTPESWGRLRNLDGSDHTRCPFMLPQGTDEAGRARGGWSAKRCECLEQGSPAQRICSRSDWMATGSWNKKTRTLEVGRQKGHRRGTLR